MMQNKLLYQKIIICLGIAFCVMMIFCQVYQHEFIYLDDPLYVTNNEMVQKGLTTEGLFYSFSSFFAANWHPLAWLSHMLDCQLFGVASGPHHFINLLFHLFNSMLLFLFLSQATKSIYRSAFVAILFAVHPMHVESVAWIAERKDVLSAFWFILVLWSYVKYYNKGKSKGYYCLALLLYLFGLMSKPMLVTLPCILLLFDFWPLNRIQFDALRHLPTKKITFLLYEKLPFFVLSAFSCVITYIAQNSAGATYSIEILTFSSRFANALNSYAQYLYKGILPIHLSVLYPYLIHVSSFSLLGSIVLLTGISLFVVRFNKSKPYLSVGWFWFLGTLVPVIGLIQVGMQAMADRYTYIPYIGLFILIAWLIPDINSNRRRMIYLPVISAVLLAMMFLSYRQTTFWKNTMTLYTHALKVNPDNYIVNFFIAETYCKEKNFDEAILHIQKIIDSHPNSLDAVKMMADTCFEAQRYEDAITYYHQAIQRKPHDSVLQLKLADTYLMMGSFEMALESYAQVLKMDPGNAAAHMYMADIYSKRGSVEKAVQHYDSAIKSAPSVSMAYIHCGAALYAAKKYAAALPYYQKAIERDPKNKEVHYQLGKSLIPLNRLNESINAFQGALRIDPDYEAAKHDLKLTLKIKEALALALKKSLKQLSENPQSEALHIQVGNIYKKLGEFDRMFEQYQQALIINPASITAQLKIANHYLVQADYDRAIVALQKILTIDSSRKDICYNMACLFALKAKTELATEWLGKAIEKGYQDCEKLETDQDLKSIRGASAFKELTKKICFADS